MHVVGECQSKVLPFSRLQNELFSLEEDTNKETYDMIGDMAVTVAKALLANILDEKRLQNSICQVMGEDYVGIIHPMMTMRLVFPKWHSMIPLKYLLSL